jgi:hypothetical protein
MLFTEPDFRRENSVKMNIKHTVIKKSVNKLVDKVCTWVQLKSLLLNIFLFTHFFHRQLCLNLMPNFKYHTSLGKTDKTAVLT